MDALPIPTARRPLGESHLQVFPLAYGCWRFAGTTVAEARAKVEAALEIGIDLFDHADIYGGDGAAEDLFGRMLAESPGLRERMVIASKGGIVPGLPYDSRPEHLAATCEASLKRLRVDVIDLWQVHRPDLLTHPQELARTLERLRRDGKVREVGVSNFSPSQLAALQHHLPFPLTTAQPELSPWRLDPLWDGVLDQCMQYGLTPLAWSPLAGGRLGLPEQEARREPDGERLARLVATLDRLAQREGVPRQALVLAWILAHPSGPIPILGTQRPERIRESAQALGVRLSRSDWYAVVEASLGESLP